MRGPVSTAFPEGKPAAPPADRGQGAEPEPEADAPHLAESAQPIELIVVADADLLGDHFWVQVQNLFGQIAWAAHDLRQRRLRDQRAGQPGRQQRPDQRARPRAVSRPFERVEAIRRDAEQRFLARSRRSRASSRRPRRASTSCSARRGTTR